MKKLLTLLVCITLSACAGGGKTGSSGVISQKRSIAGLDVAVWLPDASVNAGPWPVVVFSHGFHGCNTQSTFLMEAMARAGYAVFAPNHADATCQEGGAASTLPEVAFRDADKWTEDTFRERGQDISKLLTALEKDTRFGNKKQFDWEHIGLTGHSLGGYTVLGVAGSWPTWKDQRVREERIQAVLALSPYTAPYILKNSFHYMYAPVMYQGGSKDNGVTPYINKGKGAYDKTPAPKYYVEFDGARHFAWSDKGREQFHPAIVNYSLAFLNHYLKGQPFPPGLMQKQPGVSDYREMTD